MSWYNTGEPRQDWASSWRHFRTLRETQDYKIIHLVFKHKNDSSDSKWVPSVCRSVGYLLSLSSERPRGLWMEMSGEDDGYWADKTAETRLRFKSDDGHFCYHCEQIHKKTKLTVNVSQPAPTLRVCRRRYRKHYLLIEGQSQGESDELGDGVLGCGRVQDQAHLPAPEDTTWTCHQISRKQHHKPRQPLHADTLCQTPFTNMSI